MGVTQWGTRAGFREKDLDDRLRRIFKEIQRQAKQTDDERVLRIFDHVRQASAGVDHKRLLLLFNEIKQTPGVSLTELTKAAGLTIWQTLKAVDGLERARVTRSVYVKHERRLFLRGDAQDAAAADAETETPRLHHLIAVLRHGRALKVAAFIHQHPGMSQGELTKRLRIPQPRFLPLKHDLIAAGLIREQQDAVDRRVRRYYSTRALPPALEALRDGPLSSARPRLTR